MFKGLCVENNELVWIDTALENPEKSYVCPICKTSLILRKGKTVSPHFAHKSLAECDTWKHDMSDWHREWQERFPEKYREVVLTLEYTEEEYRLKRNSFEGKYSSYEEHDAAWKAETGQGTPITITHRADVCIGKYVIEFQHSPLSSAEFEERIWFYTALGYDLLWVFDLQEKVKDRIVFNYSKGNDISKWSWDRASKTFVDFIPQDEEKEVESPRVRLYFQVKEDLIARVVWAIYDEEYGITRFKRFCTKDSKSVSKNDFVRRSKLNILI